MKYILIILIFLLLFGCTETISSEKEVKENSVVSQENKTVTVELVRPPFLDEKQGG